MVFRLSVQISRSFTRSTRRLCERRKSLPIIGCVTSAIMKRHEYFWRPRLSVIWRVPNVLIWELLAAMREWLQVFCGIMLNSEPVSTRKYFQTFNHIWWVGSSLNRPTDCLLSTGWYVSRSSLKLAGRYPFLSLIAERGMVLAHSRKFFHLCWRFAWARAELTKLCSLKGYLRCSSGVYLHILGEPSDFSDSVSF